MKCFNCGAVLKTTDYCPQCGTDVKLYRRLLRLSAAYYNEGLEKAKVRDLSGAIVSLRQSLKINKNNTDARNLLGLVYFEMGEVVDALSQWIISKSFQGEKNLAEYYIEEVQNNPAQLETINTTIKKYNQSLVYCEQESYDLAIIQLKKVLSMNGNLLRGHQLLALLYIKNENYGRARTELKRVLAIDRTNTRALRYLKELDLITGSDSKKSSKNTAKSSSKAAVMEMETQSKDAISYTSGNETIIQPVGVKDNSWLLTIINVLIGLGIGAAVMWFLVVPAQQKWANDELNKAVAEYSDQVESKTAALSKLEEEMKSMEQEVEDAQKAQSEAEGKLKGQEELLAAYRLYAQQNSADSLTKLETIDKESLTDDGKILYDAVFKEVGAQAVQDLYKSGYAAYQANDFAKAIQDLGKCYELDNTQGDALYFLGRSYQKSGDKEKARDCYQKVIAGWPGTRKATDATNLMSGL